ncbi:YraN family protein [Xanthomonas fragariae]|uniref:YraN family protein n=1 Tax=Xanthomonas fragariae TaxID=48664 RepID=UPI001ABDA2B9|nr:YraN family protein [Xanthomonas fragariae]UKR53126.1 YraN family protein [Xanthomonas fragariae]WAT15513.1 YraN family protein [Xanthomonas fragariae]
MSAARRQRGAAVEAAARALLEQAGLRLVVGNANYRGGELDLVMRDGQSLVFVEVRYRRDDRFGGGAASVDRRKRRKLVLAAQLFLASHPELAALPCRFDVVDGSGEPSILNWIRDAFRADDC